MSSSSITSASSTNPHHPKDSTVIKNSSGTRKVTAEDIPQQYGNSNRRMNGGRKLSLSNNWGSNGAYYSKNFHLRHSNGIRGKNPRSNLEEAPSHKQNSLKCAVVQTSRGRNCNDITSSDASVNVKLVTEKPAVSEIGQQTDCLKEVRDDLEKGVVSDENQVSDSSNGLMINVASISQEGNRADIVQNVNFVPQNHWSSATGAWVTQQHFQMPYVCFTGYQHPVPDYYLDPENSQLIFTPSGLAIPRTNHYTFLQQQMALDENYYYHQHQPSLKLEQPVSNGIPSHQTSTNGVIQAGVVSYGTPVGMTNLPSPTSTSAGSCQSLPQLDLNRCGSSMNGQPICGLPGIIATDGNMYYFHPIGDQGTSTVGKSIRDSAHEKGKTLFNNRTRKGNGSKGKIGRDKKLDKVEILQKPTLSSLDEFPHLSLDQKEASKKTSTDGTLHPFKKPISTIKGKKIAYIPHDKLNNHNNEDYTDRSLRKVNYSKKKVVVSEGKSQMKKNKFNKKIIVGDSPQGRSHKAAPQDDNFSDASMLSRNQKGVCAQGGEDSICYNDIGNV